MTRVMNVVRFTGAYVWANLRIALAYRAAFFSAVLGMVINDAIWVVFWWLFFTRFPSLDGYGFRDIVIVWSICATAFGLAVGLAGGAFTLASRIARGELDFYLVLPKPVILHLVVSRMDTSGWGDALFGVAVFAFLASPTPMDAVAFVGLSLIATLIVVSYAIAVNSLAFWTGRAETLSDQLIFGLITFATYPEKLFTGAVKVVLYTVVPAGFVAYIPVGLLHEWDWGWALVLLAGTIGSISVAVTTFTVGLRRYQSGNLTAMRA